MRPRAGQSAKASWSRRRNLDGSKAQTWLSGLCQGVEVGQPRVDTEAVPDPLHPSCQGLRSCLGGTLSMSTGSCGLDGTALITLETRHCPHLAGHPLLPFSLSQGPEEMASSSSGVLGLFPSPVPFLRDPVPRVHLRPVQGRVCSLTSTRTAASPPGPSHKQPLCSCGRTILFCSNGATHSHHLV